MKHILVATFITLLALGTGCAWISPASETASDGINVHGHWTVTVTNPDGTLDAVHEFDNGLTGNSIGSGADLLTALVAGETSITAHTIDLITNIETNNFLCAQPTQYETYSNVVSLWANVTRDVAPDTPIRFKASCVFIFNDPQESLEIQSVRTQMRIGEGIESYNKGGDLPSYIAGGIYNPFTSKDIENITVKHNQGVFINVVISFN
tara:strand:+ start:14 stop:637 length:624 start_codon:yes stop_codon:yes gene_type:complete